MELVADPSVRDLYTSNTTNGNSGYDLYVVEDVTINANKTEFINFKVRGKTKNGAGYMLLPRSSISKTPLRLANSVGLIDPTYRGELMAAFYNTSSEAYEVKKGTRIAQLALANLGPFSVTWVESLDATERGDGGFGSTGGVNYVT